MKALPERFIFLSEAPGVGGQKSPLCQTDFSCLLNATHLTRMQEKALVNVKIIDTAMLNCRRGFYIYRAVE